MKKFLLFILACILQVSLFGLELVKEVKLERVDNQPYSDIYKSDYDLKLKQLIILTPLSNIISNTQLKTTNKTFNGVFMFSDKGKFLGKVGKFNSHDKDGIISVCRQPKIIGDKINIRDDDKKSLTIFSAEKPFKYLYSVKNILPNPWFSQPDFVKDSLAFFLQTRDNKRDSKNHILIDQYKKTAVGKVVDTDNPEMKMVTNLKRILSYKKYFDLFWNDKKVLKNKRIKKYLKRMKFESKEYSLLAMPGGIAPRFSDAIFILGNENNFYAAVRWGTEIEYYDKNGNLLDTYIINKFKEHRMDDASLYKQHIIKELKMKTDLREFREKYILSTLLNGFYDSQKHYLILRYILSKDFRELANLSDNKFQLLVYSLDKRKAVSDFIPIDDFIPAQFDSEKRELIGVQQRDGDIYLQFYKWEY